MSETTCSVPFRPYMSNSPCPIRACSYPSTCSGPFPTCSRERVKGRPRPVPEPPVGNGVRNGPGLEAAQPAQPDGTGHTRQTRTYLDMGWIERARTAPQSPVTAPTRPATLTDTPQAVSVDLRAAR